MSYLEVSKSFLTGRVRVGLAAVAAVAITALSAGVASANLLDPTEIGCSLANFEGSTSCRTDLPGGPGGGGNVTVAGMNGSVFGTLVAPKLWQELGEIETNDNGTPKPSSAPFTITFKGGTLYEWALNQLLAFKTGEYYAFAIKAGSENQIPFNVVYLMDNSFRSGEFDVKALKTNDLSNIRLFGTHELAVIPLPAAGWLLLAGIGGLAAARRMKKAA